MISVNIQNNEDIISIKVKELVQHRLIIVSIAEYDRRDFRILNADFGSAFSIALVDRAADHVRISSLFDIFLLRSCFGVSFSIFVRSGLISIVSSPSMTSMRVTTRQSRNHRLTMGNIHLTRLVKETTFRWCMNRCRNSDRFATDLKKNDGERAGEWRTWNVTWETVQVDVGQVQIGNNIVVLFTEIIFRRFRLRMWKERISEWISKNEIWWRWMLLKVNCTSIEQRWGEEIVDIIFFEWHFLRLSVL